MTDRNPIPYCLSHLTQRDTAVRAIALEASQAALREIAIQQTTDEMSHDDGRHGDLEGAYNTVIDTARCALILSPVWPPAPASVQSRGPHNACDGGTCDQPDNCAKEGECHYTKSPFQQGPPAPEPDETETQVAGSVIDGINASCRDHQGTTHEIGGVTDPAPGANDGTAPTPEPDSNISAYVDWKAEATIMCDERDEACADRAVMKAERDQLLAIRAELVAALEASARITDIQVKAALGAVTKELPESIQYCLIRGLSAMGFAQPSIESWDIMRAALEAAIPTPPAPAPNEAAIRAELVAALRGLMDAICDTGLHNSQYPGAAMELANAALAKATA